MPTYTANITRTQRLHVLVIAPDRDTALKDVLKNNPGFTLEDNTLTEETTAGKTIEHDLLSRCEGCDRPIWSDCKHGHDRENGGYFCAECADELQSLTA